jgi:hypothetical protein
VLGTTVGAAGVGTDGTPEVPPQKAVVDTFGEHDRRTGNTDDEGEKRPDPGRLGTDSVSIEQIHMRHREGTTV